VFHILDKIKVMFSKKQQDKQAVAAAQQRKQGQQAPPPVLVPGHSTQVNMGCQQLTDLDGAHFVGWAHCGSSAEPQLRR
jgi:hypothetical protein